MVEFPPTTNERFSRFIRAKSAEYNLSPADLADSLKVVKAPGVYKWFESKTQPRLPTLVLISCLFNCPIENLFGLEPTGSDDEPSIDVLKKAA